ncbi:MAG TPA: hypothetical protein VE642_13175 [Pyrinomonadaceae bacterium]|jgi:hypothetical protein|nr:hypothetical protein [Pyrinomonadaceae bacterium]
MSGKHLLPTIVLALAAGFAGHALRGEPSTRAAGPGAPDPADLQWEYCAVVKAQYVGSPQGGVYWVAYFKGEGVRTEDVRVGPTGNAFAKAVAKLGEDGWDMVGQGPLEIRPGPGGTTTAVFFKRQKD